MYSIYTDYEVPSINKMFEGSDDINATYQGQINDWPDIFDKVNFNEKTYVIGVISDKHKIALAQELSVLAKGIEFEFERDAICPYCGSGQMDSWELPGNDGEENETECGKCGEEFKYVRNIEVTYSTYQK